MGRPSQGWKLRPTETGYYQVRFSHKGHRYELTTGERDSGAAADAAAKLYADVISGRWIPQTGPLSGIKAPPLALLFAEWLAAFEADHGPGSHTTYQIYVKAHFLPAFESLDRLTKASAAEYIRARLAKVTAKSVRKELSALRSFVRWLVEQGVLSEEAAPVIPPVPKRSTGTRTLAPRRRPDLTDAVMARVLAALPETMTSRKTGAVALVRARFVVAWETGLRPATLSRLRAPDHYRHGQGHLSLTADIDKARWAREVPLTPAARAALDAVCPERGLLFGTHDYRTVVQQAGEAAGIPDLTPYDLRHGRITSLVEATGNLPGVAYLVGHTQVTTTNLYTHRHRRAADDVLRSVGSSGLVLGLGKGRKPRAKEGT